MAKPFLYDCIIIGGGPAGLMTATYLARFRRKILIIDNKQSRAGLIPLSHNYPGTEKGISGRQILKKLRDQALAYKVKIISDTAVKLSKLGNGNFKLKTQKKALQSKTIILATGAKDIEPALPSLKNKIREGKLRHCMVCDAFEVTNQKAIILGDDKHAFNEVMFLLTYTSKISLVTLGCRLRLDEKHRATLKQKGIAVFENKVCDIRFLPKKITVCFENGATISADTMYSALGAIPQADLAMQVKAKIDKKGFVITDKNKMTNIEGLYAIGDLCKGVSQITTGFGHAAVSACAVHNYLRKIKC